MKNEAVEIVDLSVDRVEECRVCGSFPASKSYGALVCAGCKNFFLRVTTTGATVPTCKNSNLCADENFYGLVGKAKCAECRYERCLEVGMIPEITARRKGCGLREKRAKIALWMGGRTRKSKDVRQEILEDVRQSTSQVMVPALVKQETLEEDAPSTSQLISLDSRELQLSTKAFAKPFYPHQAQDGTDLIKNMIYIRDLIMNDDANQTIVLDFPFSTNVSLDQLLQNPLLVCGRTPISMRPEATPPVSPECQGQMGVRIFCRSIVLFADWCRSVPEFQELPMVDRMDLLAQQALVQGMFNCYFYTHKYNYTQGMVTTFGIVRADLAIPGAPELHDSYYFYSHFGSTVVIPCMKRAEMREEEFLLMKNIILFSSGFGLSDPSNEITRRAYNKYTSILLQHLMSRFKPASLAVKRFIEMMDLPKCIQNISRKMGADLGKSVLHKLNGMSGRLPEEVFFRQ